MFCFTHVIEKESNEEGLNPPKKKEISTIFFFTSILSLIKICHQPLKNEVLFFQRISPIEEFIIWGKLDSSMERYVAVETKMDEF